MERVLADESIIVSKTDLKGVLTYVNDTFVEISGFSEEELLGRPHNIVRHADMPRAVFALLWDCLTERREVFAYVLNRCADGGSYWVLAHVTPTFDAAGRVVGYHSNRRAPSRAAVQAVLPLYRRLLAAEQAVTTGRAATEAGRRALEEVLAERGLTYDELVWQLIGMEDAA